MRIAARQVLVSPRAIARLLAAVAIFLVLASIAGQFLKFALGYDHLRYLIVLFHVDAERNIPTYFSVLLMFFAAVLLAVIAVLNRSQRAAHALKWAWLSFVFLCMAFDEAFEFHERAIGPIRALWGDGHLGVFYFAWVIPGIVLVLVLGLFFLRFLLDLPAAVRLRFLVAASLYIGGAIGVELIGGRHAELHGQENWIYSMMATVEESLEMAGLIVFIWALLKYLAESHQEVSFRFEG
jgi:hypothetical protein